MSHCNSLRRRAVHPFLAAVLLVAVGCSSSPYLPPREVAQITFEYRSSPAVIVERAWIERRDGNLNLVGYVSAGPRPADTRRTRLEVTFRDASGTARQSLVGAFEPAQVPRPVRMRGGVSWFRIPLPPEATEIRQVTVAALDT